MAVIAALVVMVMMAMRAVMVVMTVREALILMIKIDYALIMQYLQPGNAVKEIQ